MSVRHYLLVCLIHITNCQVPKHVDLQKVGEMIFNNEKYNVLRPTVHKITDHFKDFMLRRENKNKNERIFLDDDGFRHYWSGFGEKTESLRKTEISLYEINKNNVNEPGTNNADSENIEKGPNEGEVPREVSGKEILRVAATTKPPAKPAAVTKKPAAAAAKPAVTTKPAAAAAKPAAAAAKPAAATTKPAAAAAKPAAATTKPAAAKPAAAKPAGNAASGVGAAKPKAGKKVARTSFFCPFYGVITMVTYI